MARASAPRPGRAAFMAGVATVLAMSRVLMGIFLCRDGSCHMAGSAQPFRAGADGCTDLVGENGPAVQAGARSGPWPSCHEPPSSRSQLIRQRALIRVGGDTNMRFLIAFLVVLSCGAARADDAVTVSTLLHQGFDVIAVTQTSAGAGIFMR